MSDFLAVIGPRDDQDAVLEELARRRPDRVTVLLEEEAPNWAADDSAPGVARRDRLAALLHAIERRTGAVVVGLAGSSEQLRGWRFDHVVRAPMSAPAAA